MIQNLEIQNYKSIKHLQLPCKKVNIFIGEPNAGKSNIIEALCLTSIRKIKTISDLIRFKDLSDLFIDFNLENKIRISYDSIQLLLYFGENPDSEFTFQYSSSDKPTEDNVVTYRETGIFESGSTYWHDIQLTSFYKYKSESLINNKSPGSLKSPHGENLVAVIRSNQELKGLVEDIFKSKGFRLNINPVERDMLISRLDGDQSYIFRYSNISETLKRIIFLMACLETNKNTTILFDEPEANMFPFYTKYFAERLASDETNQYFFSTHNSYLLNTLVSKISVNDLNICLTYMEDYQTKIHVMTNNEVSELVNSEVDLSLNLEHFLEKE